MMDVRRLAGALIALMLACPMALCEEAEKGGEKAKKEVKEEKKKDGDAVPQSNPFTRFWIHTVGGPMARGLKDGTRDVYKGMRHGTHRIKEAFMGVGGYKRSESSGKDEAEGGDLERVGFYSKRQKVIPINWEKYPGLKAALKHFGPQESEEAEEN